MSKGGLGAGLDSLFSDNSSAIQVKSTLRTSEIEPKPGQPFALFQAAVIRSLQANAVGEPLECLVSAKFP